MAARLPVLTWDIAWDTLSDMRRLSLLFLIFLTAADARADLPVGAWSRILNDKHKVVMAREALLTPEQTRAIERFVRDEYAAHSGFYDATNFVGCSTRNCLEVYRVRVGSSDIFVVSPTRREKNPAWWLLKVKGTHVSNIAPPLGSDRCWFGYIYEERGIHNGRHDLSATKTSGAARRDIAYFEFDGSQYRAVGEQSFVVCDDLPGRSVDHPKWCFEETGKPVGTQQ